MAARLKHAILDWDAPTQIDGAPRSFLFDDIYFSGAGAAESEHVFLAGNDLPRRFAGAAEFSIGELGFGTGLNFLVAWKAWVACEKPTGARLHFLSVEKYPLTLSDLEKAHASWPGLSDYARELRRALPPAFPGFHHIEIADDVTLTLLYGDALDVLKSAEATIDAWFLDGFAPAKNPEMWSPALFAEIARVSAQNATFATFTVAGDVRRALAGAGFDIEKRTGFGRKREMLVGRLARSSQKQSHRAPWFVTHRAGPLKRTAKIAIIGAGVAGASLAQALRSAGYAPTIYDATAPASGASGNPAGLIMPRLDVGDTPAGRFHAAAYLHAARLLNDLPAGVFNPCGVNHLAANEKEKTRQQKLIETAALPEDWLTQTDAGICYPQGGVVDPKKFVAAQMGETTVNIARVITIEKTQGGWRLKTTSGNDDADAVIIANAHDARWFVQARGLPLSGSAGQIDWFPDAAAPDTAFAFGPYAAPAPEGGLMIGATYAPETIGSIPRFSREATESNIAAVARERPDLVAGLDPTTSRPRVSVRCTTPDRLPIAGAVPDWGFYAGAYDGLRTGLKTNYPQGEGLAHLYILTGLGSRGLVTAPLCAAMIAAEISGAPAPVASDIAEALHPARFYIRDLKRKR